ncbi:MAG TPA: hypothetical protein PKA61_02870, partial [Nitrospira sp.]|nr:hypothetical protein [Nitrospira sp.]
AGEGIPGLDAGSGGGPQGNREAASRSIKLMTAQASASGAVVSLFQRQPELRILSSDYRPGHRSE